MFWPFFLWKIPRRKNFPWKSKIKWKEPQWRLASNHCEQCNILNSGKCWLFFIKKENEKTRKKGKWNEDFPLSQRKVLIFLSTQDHNKILWTLSLRKKKCDNMKWPDFEGPLIGRSYSVLYTKLYNFYFEKLIKQLNKKIKLKQKKNSINNLNEQNLSKEIKWEN